MRRAGRFRRRLDPVALAGFALFVATGWWTTGLIPAGHEEVSTFPHRAVRVLVHGPSPGELHFEPSCADPDAPLLAVSEARPTLALCASGLSLPVLIAPYASGVPHWHAMLGWPLHRGEVFGLRRWTLLAGLLSMLLAFLLIRRVEGRTTASVTALTLAACSPFVVLHSLLMQYEAAPWMFTMGAALVALGVDRAADLSLRRAAAIGALAGLALLANVKAVFFFIPMLLVGWRAGAFRGLRLSPAATVVGAGVVAAAPLVVLNRIHGGGGLDGQVAQRASAIAQPRSLAEMGGELLNIVRFASDTASYGTREWTPVGWLGVAAATIAAVSLLWVTAQAVRFFATGKGSPAAAFCGLMAVSFVVISLELYDQTPAANYGPLHAIFGIAIALTLVQGARLVADRLGWPLGRTALVLAVACMVPMAATTIRRIASTGDMHLSINARAERELTAFLLAEPRPDAHVLTTTYNLAGVIDSLARGEVSTIRLDRALSCPLGQVSESCLTESWQAVLASPDLLPARVVLPSVATLSDEDEAMLLMPALRQAAERAGLDFAVEGHFRTGDGTVALTLVRVEASRPEP